MTITCVVMWLVRILHLPGKSVKKKMEGMFSYMVFTSSGSSIAARAHLRCCCTSGVGERGKKREVNKLELFARCVRRQ